MNEFGEREALTGTREGMVRELLKKTEVGELLAVALMLIKNNLKLTLTME